MSEYRDTTVRDKILGMMKAGMKSVTVYDASGRASEVYEAGLNASLGEPCLVTRYKYRDGDTGNSFQVLAYEERVDAWPGYTIVGGTDNEDINTVP